MSDLIETLFCKLFGRYAHHLMSLEAGKLYNTQMINSKVLHEMCNASGVVFHQPGYVAQRPSRSLWVKP